MVDQDNHQDVTIATLKTPPLHIQPAALTRRGGAVLIDSMIIGLGWLGVTHVSAQPPFISLSFMNGTILFLIGFFYYSLMEGLFSATLGKRVMKIRVVGANGDPCTITESALRNLLRVVDWLPFCYLLGIGLLISNKKQRVGDKIAHTIVTIAPERDNTPPSAPFLFH